MNKSNTKSIFQRVRKYCDPDFMLGACLTTAGLLMWYKVGYTDGLKNGRNCVLNRITETSAEKGLKLKNSFGERWLFTAQKLIDKTE